MRMPHATGHRLQHTKTTTTNEADHLSAEPCMCLHSTPKASLTRKMKSLVVLLALFGVSRAFRPHNVRRALKTRYEERGVFSVLATVPPVRSSVLRATDDDADANSEKKSPKKSKNANRKKGPKRPRTDEPTQTKEDLVRAVGEKMRQKKQGQSKAPEESNLFDKLNPFKAGQSLRKSIDTALTSIAMPPETKSRYYIDDRISELGTRFSEQDSLLDRLEQEDFIPEVLVVGATGEIGRLVVRRLLLEGRFRVRVLVRDLYTQTLNLLGTGVTYCQGDLNNMDSLEYALTDVDKIVFCAAAPGPDEDQFRQKFEDYVKENLDSIIEHPDTAEAEKSKSEIEWERLESVLEVRARLAEQVDCIGMQNLVRAYQDVRHVDYGTSQAAKRSLFKFQDRPEDFNLFAIDEDDDDNSESDVVVVASSKGKKSGASLAADSYAGYEDEEKEDEYENEDDPYADYGEGEDEYADYDDEYAGSEVEERRDTSVKTQVQWIRNKFEHGVFVGRVPKATDINIGGEAAVVSSRLRSREEPDNGIDLGSGFAGFVCRVCSDGRTYEAFVRTGAYNEDGIEYVCEFSTSKKPTGRNKSQNRFTTVRLPFESFKPIRRKIVESASDTDSIPAFRGLDVRNIGFRYRSTSNPVRPQLDKGDLSSFYLALCYIKLYRSQPEPEFIYLSNARIPQVVTDGMVRHDLRQLNTATDQASGDTSVQILDDSTLKTATRDKTVRSQEEIYYKYRGEEILKNSGLSYTVVRVAGLNDSPTGEASTLALQSSNEDEVVAVSRAEVAQVCVSALLSPAALNKSFYISKKKGGKSTSKDEDLLYKFSALPADVIR